MNVKFEQLFYGRGKGGYGVLGASPGGRRFAARVEKLCGGVGTPGGEYGGEPFLLSVPEGEFVVMVCGRRGAPDSMGRNTLFFHVLVARREELDAAEADAFSLFVQGAFAGSMPTGEIAALDIEAEKRVPLDLATPARRPYPAVIRSARSETEAVRGLAGGRENALAWASRAFQVMPGFDIQVVPLRTALPRGVNEYDAAGRLVRSAGVGAPQEVAKPSRPADPAVEGKEPLKASGKNPPNPSGKTCGVLLGLSLAANAALALLLVLSRQSVSPELSAEIERSAVERYRGELAAQFPRDARIDDFKEAASKLPRYDKFQGNWTDYREANAFLVHVKTYVDFANGILGMAAPLERESIPAGDDGRARLATIAEELAIPTDGKTVHDLENDIRFALHREARVPEACDDEVFGEMLEGLTPEEAGQLREYQTFISQLQGTHVIVVAGSD